LQRRFFLTTAADHFVRPHRSLRAHVYGRWMKRTSGMVADLTNHPWTVEKLLRFRVSLSQNAA
jgi:hypothetical protein